MPNLFGFGRSLETAWYRLGKLMVVHTLVRSLLHTLVVDFALAYWQVFQLQTSHPM
jgi:hypothetical protein